MESTTLQTSPVFLPPKPMIPIDRGEGRYQKVIFPKWPPARQPHGTRTEPRNSGYTPIRLPLLRKQSRNPVILITKTWGQTGRTLLFAVPPLNLTKTVERSSLSSTVPAPRVFPQTPLTPCSSNLDREIPFRDTGIDLRDHSDCNSLRLKILPLSDCRR